MTSKTMTTTKGDILIAGATDQLGLAALVYVSGDVRVAQQARQPVKRFPTEQLKSMKDPRDEFGKTHRIPTASITHMQLAPWQARRAFEFIEANVGRTIKIEEIAAAVRLSAGYFSRAFRVDFGLSPYAYVIRRKVQRTQELMLVADKPLAAVAAACGFADQAHFTRLFRRIVGVTPARWQRFHCVGRYAEQRNAEAPTW
jgi:AraC-like DNA-binding protein